MLHRDGIRHRHDFIMPAYASGRPTEYKKHRT
jgi:hypothetical protein